MMKRIFLLLFVICCFVANYAQTSTGENPVGFGLTLRNLSMSDNIKILPTLNMNKIKQEDLQDEQNGLPPRFGYPHKVDFNTDNSGVWQDLPNGDKIWQLTISCPQALSINFLYDKFWLPTGSKFFVYTSDKKYSIGAFTSKNNKGNKSNIQGFATGLLYGSEVTLEYYQPQNINDNPIISIAYVVQGYRYINLPEASTRALNESGSCQVNINCPEGQNWQHEKNAVALILVNGNRYCTGSLINTTANDNRPLFLTADHCLGGWGNNYTKYDAIYNPILNHWSFYWQYETPTCDNVILEPPILSTVGATVVANNETSDFALLRLTEDPRDKQGATPFYLGWDRSGSFGTGGVGIHHPSGDVKKIATLNHPTTNNWNGNYNYWSHYWDATLNGYSVTEGGSSGSPLINNNRHIIGQLRGGSYINCSNPSQDIAAYGKFSISWTGNNDPDLRRQLKHWLDPLNTNLQTLDGIGVSIPDFQISVITPCHQENGRWGKRYFATPSMYGSVNHHQMIYDWGYVSLNNPYGQYTHVAQFSDIHFTNMMPFISLPPEGEYQVQMKASIKNTYYMKTFYLNDTGCSGSYSFYLFPNPAKSTVTLKMTEYEIVAKQDRNINNIRNPALEWC
ncbi:MAG: hypothetical protein Q4G63_05670 [Bacteroidia bacterium]|nr:hypothetical protein [Bacteroidia bacterium]